MKENRIIIIYGDHTYRMIKDRKNIVEYMDDALYVYYEVTQNGMRTFIQLPASSAITYIKECEIIMQLGMYQCEFGDATEELLAGDKKIYYPTKLCELMTILYNTDILSIFNESNDQAYDWDGMLPSIDYANIKIHLKSNLPKIHLEERAIKNDITYEEGEYYYAYMRAGIKIGDSMKRSKDTISFLLRKDGTWKEFNDKGDTAIHIKKKENVLLHAVSGYIGKQAILLDQREIYRLSRVKDLTINLMAVSSYSDDMELDEAVSLMNLESYDDFYDCIDRDNIVERLYEYTYNATTIGALADILTKIETVGLLVKCVAFPFAYYYSYTSGDIEKIIDIGVSIELETYRDDGKVIKETYKELYWHNRNRKKLTYSYLLNIIELSENGEI